MKDRRTVSRADYEQVSDDLAHALAEIGMLEAEIERLTELVKDASVPWHARYLQQDGEIERLRAALWTEYQESFNDLGSTRQARWESADAYANALMADFDADAADAADAAAATYRAALKGAEDE